MLICFIISAIIGITLFLCLYWGFITGMRLGIQTAKGQEPPPIHIRTPVQVYRDIKQTAEQEKEARELAKDMELINNYTGDIPKGGEE